MSFKIELGSTVRDKTTGYTGLVTGRTEWLYGCRRYTVQSQKLHDGKPIESVGCDEDALLVLKTAKPAKLLDTGGPQPEPSRPRNARR